MAALKKDAKHPQSFDFQYLFFFDFFVCLFSLLFFPPCGNLTCVQKCMFRNMVNNFRCFFFRMYLRIVYYIVLWFLFFLFFVFLRFTFCGCVCEREYFAEYE